MAVRGKDDGKDFEDGVGNRNQEAGVRGIASSFDHGLTPFYLTLQGYHLYPCYDLPFKN